MAEFPAELNAFDPAARRRALDALLAGGWQGAPGKAWVNMHLHTFFSYNGEGWSPTRLALEAKRVGLYAAGIVDFDVLDGVTEWFAAADRLGLRAAAGFETRVYLAEMAEHEITSPGEPGVTYYMGFGYARPPAAGSGAAARFAQFLEQAHRRNRELIARLNARVGDLAIDYDRDVLPATPAGNATERHIVRAYHDRAMALAEGSRARAAALWSAVLSLPAAELETKLASTNGFVDLLRSRMMKKGGLGYVQPSRDTFPPIEDVVRLILDGGAIPMHTWLDGMSSGEQDPDVLLDCVTAKGSEAVNIVPDRNWNYADSAERERKVAALNRFVAACRKRDLPMNVGTELNRPGQRFVDDFAAPALAPLQADFLAGAQVMVGHTRLLRWADYAYTGAAAKAEFATRKARNAFFAAVGALPPPEAPMLRRLEAAGPAEALELLRTAATAGRWVS